jgi:predicted lipoprotein with Yx(FWY)xxD motif
MKKIEIILILLILAGAVLFTGCTQPAASPTPPAATTAPPATAAPMIPATPPAAIDTVTVATSAQYGPILANVDEMTLYYTLMDAPGSMTSACTGGCATTWPPFYTEKIQVSPPLQSSNFGVITRPDGTKQTTYMGWPLYTYSADVAPGDTNGYGVATVWYVMGTGGVVTLVPTTAPGGGGY